MTDENHDTRQLPATPWDQPPPPPQADAPASTRSEPPGRPPRAKLVRPKRRIGLLIVILAVVGFLGLVALLLLGSVLSLASSGYRLEEVEPGSVENRVLLIRVEDVITSGGGSAPRVIEELGRLRKEGVPLNVKTVLLYVDSPGGAVTPCDIIDDEIQKCRAQGIKFVAFFDDIAASGGYYVSARADTIVARPTSIIGSIGVLQWHFNMEKLLTERLGIEDETVTSGRFKNTPNMFRPMTDEERDQIRARIDRIHDRFVKIVAEGRGLAESQVREFADGRVFDAAEAKELKMIDAIGHWDEAVAEARKLAGPGAQIVTYHRRRSPLRLMLESGAASERLPESLSLRLDLAVKQRLCYLWLP